MSTRRPSKHQDAILAYIRATPGVRQIEIASDLRMDPGNVSYSIKRLLHRRLIVEEEIGPRKYIYRAKEHE